MYSVTKWVFQQYFKTTFLFVANKIVPRTFGNNFGELNTKRFF